MDIVHKHLDASIIYFYIYLYMCVNICIYTHEHLCLFVLKLPLSNVKHILLAKQVLLNKNFIHYIHMLRSFMYFDTSPFWLQSCKIERCWSFILPSYSKPGPPSIFDCVSKKIYWGRELTRKKTGKIFKFSYHYPKR